MRQHDFQEGFLEGFSRLLARRFQDGFLEGVFQWVLEEGGFLEGVLRRGSKKRLMRRHLEGVFSRVTPRSRAPYFGVLCKCLWGAWQRGAEVTTHMSNGIFMRTRQNRYALLLSETLQTRYIGS